MLLDNEALASAQGDSRIEVISFEHDLLGENATFHFGVLDQSITLAHMVPVVRDVCSRVLARVEQDLDRKGSGVPCAVDCAVCCRFLIFLSIPEAFRLVEDVLALPVAQRDSVMVKAADLYKRFQSQLSQPVPPESQDETPEAKLFRCYRASEPDCPFLDQETCSFYLNRPMVCREHMVSGSAQCASTGEQPPDVVVPISMAETLAQLAMEVEQGQHEVVVLPGVFEWVAANAARGQCTWPASYMVKQLIAVMQRLWLP